MSLEQREKRFNELCARFPCEHLGRLLAAYKIPDGLYETLRASSLEFLKTCLPIANKDCAEKDIMEKFEQSLPMIKNMTPNGKLMPKAYLTFDYNFFVRSVTDILESLCVEDLVENFNLPCLRYKAGTVSEDRLQRPYATEKRHMESWVGHSRNIVGLHIPLFGDLENNYLKLYAPPSGFQEHWADRKKNFSEGEKIADQYIPISITPKSGYLYFLECTSIHSSELSVNAKGRVSVDMMVDLKTKIQFGNVDTSGSLPLDAQFTFKKLKEIGRTQLLSLKENETGFIEINDIYNFSSHR